MKSTPLPKLDKNKKHTIDVVVDRLKVRADVKQRLAESFETALRHSDGQALAVEMDSGKEHLFSAKFACPVCSYSLPELEPRLFSFNNPMGACPKCDGLGQISFFDPKRVVAFPASVAWPPARSRAGTGATSSSSRCCKAWRMHYGFDLDTPFEELPENIQHILLYGSGKESLQFQVPGRKRRHADRAAIRSRASSPISSGATAKPNRQRCARNWPNTSTIRTCPDCDGTRLRAEARHVMVGGKALFEVGRLPLKQTYDFFATLEFDGQKQAIAESIVKEIAARLRFLNNVGLDYLSLDRSADTLSGGEAQRIRLASQIGSGLTGVMYVLDEPSIGLHQRDNDRLLGTLKHLRDMGNTVIVVEHDEDAILTADYVVDIGPGAGVHGGEVVAEGTPDEIKANPASLTGQYLSGKRSIAVPKNAHAPDPKRMLQADRRQRQQPEECHPRSAGRAVRVRHRRVRLGQIHPDQRYPVPRRGAPSLRLGNGTGALRRAAWPGVLRQGDRRRPKPDRAHPALQSGHLHRPVHADPRTVRRRTAGARARLRAGALLLQRQGRALRGLPGRWRDQGGNALPARHLRALRRLPRQALQPRNPGNPVQGQEHPRNPGDDGGTGARILQPGAGRGAQAADPARRRPGLHHAWARAPPRCPAARRSASSCRWNCPSATPAARCTSWTNRPPACISTTSSCC